MGLSTDSVFCHISSQKFEVGTLNYPMGSDFYPHGEVATRYGILRSGDPLPGINERAVFVVDKNGKIVFSKVYELGEAPDNEEALAALRRLA